MTKENFIADIHDAAQKKMRKDRLFLLFTHEAQNEVFNGNQDVVEGLHKAAKDEFSPVNIVFLNGNQNREGIKHFMDTNFIKKDNVIIMMADPEKGPIADVAKEDQIDTQHIEQLPRMVATWGCAVA